MMKTKLDYEDLVRLPKDGKIHEIVDGVHFNHPAPSIKHQLISANLDLIVLPHVRKGRLGVWLDSPVDVILGEFDIVQPDKVFVTSARAGMISTLNIRGVPDLVVEITSPGDPGYDRETKMALYSHHGLQNYWIVDTQLDVLEVYRHVGPGMDLFGKYRGTDFFEPELFPGLAIPMVDLFASNMF